MTLQKIHRMVWLARTLAGTGLLIAAVGLGLLGWTIYNTQIAPVHAADQRKGMKQASDQLGRLIVESHAQIQTTLDESAAKPGENGAIPNLAQLVRAQLKEHPDSTLTNLNGEATQLTKLNAQCTAWRDSYDVVWDDIGQQRTMNNVRSLIARLTGAVDEFQGQHRLDDAIRYRQWRSAPIDDADPLARQILIDEGRQQSQGSADVKDQLSELARLAELLNGEEQFDSLTDLKDIQLRPVLDRLSKSMDAFRLDPANHDVLTPQAINDISSALFGRGYVLDEAHQSIQPAPGGLFTLRWNALQLLGQREDLRHGASQLFQEIEQTWTSFDQSANAPEAVPVRQADRGVGDKWPEMWIWGGVCAALILQWLAILISRGIQRETARRLMLEKQAAAAELDKVNKQLLEISQRAGAAEASTGVLHKVDDILNRVNASANVIRDKVAQSRVGNLSKASAMIESHRADLANFLTVHEKGRQLPGYFTLISKQLSQEHEAVVTELNHLVREVEHIKEVVRSQQDPAKLSKCPST